jgi:hypothetical protein
MFYNTYICYHYKLLYICTYITIIIIIIIIITIIIIIIIIVDAQHLDHALLLYV